MKYGKAGTKIAKWLSTRGYKVIKNVIKNDTDENLKRVSMLARTLKDFAVIKYEYPPCNCCTLPVNHLLKNAQKVIKYFKDKDSALKYLTK